MAILLQAPAGAGRAGDSAVLVEQCGGLPVGEAGQAGVPARSRGPSGLGTVRFGFGGVAAPLVGVAGFLSILPLGGEPVAAACSQFSPS